jgi:hypothetical protein
LQRDDATRKVLRSLDLTSQKPSTKRAIPRINQYMKKDTKNETHEYARTAIPSSSAVAMTNDEEKLLQQNHHF